MEERILQIIKGEDSKNPLTDEEIASRLQVFREDVTTVRREHHIPDSRKRRKPVIFEDMKRILTEHPDVSDRGLTRMLKEAGYKPGDGSLIVVDDERLPLEPGEAVECRSVRFRSLGCYPLCGAVESEAASVAQVVAELDGARTSERHGRLIDGAGAASMEAKKREGYF